MTIVKPDDDTTLRVKVFIVQRIEPIENADRIELVWYKKTPCIVKKGDYTIGDLAVFIPTDHVVPDEAKYTFLSLGRTLSSDRLYVRAKDARVRACRMRGTISLGLVMPLPDDLVGKVKPGDQVGEKMNITRYIPKLHRGGGGAQLKGVMISCPWNKSVPKYDVNSWRNKDPIKEDEDVLVLEKVHGCNTRLLVMPHKPTGPIDWLYTKIYNFIQKARSWRKKHYEPRMKLWVGTRKTWRADEDSSQWWTVARDYKIKENLFKLPGMVVYGEIYGPGIQALHYSVKPGTYGFRVFDIYDINSGEWLDWEDMEALTEFLNLKVVPVLCRMPFNTSELDSMANGKSLLDNKTIREGLVVRTPVDRIDPREGRSMLKFVSMDYRIWQQDHT